MLLIGFVIMLLVVLPLARFFGIADWLGYTCDAKEKAALKEFPQYGGRTIGTSRVGGESLNFPPLETRPPGCDLGFTARHTSLKQVSAYYENKLTEHGWAVKRFAVAQKGEFEYPHVDGIRDGFHYEVHYWPAGLDSTDPADWARAESREGTTEVYVLVYRDLLIGRDRP